MKKLIILSLFSFTLFSLQAQTDRDRKKQGAPSVPAASNTSNTSSSSNAVKIKPAVKPASVTGNIGTAKMKTGTKFVIQSAMNYGRNNLGFWDVRGTPQVITNGMTFNVWALDTKAIDRLYTLYEAPESGYYYISVGDNPNMVLNTADCKGSSSGTGILAWEKHGDFCQKFYFQHLGSGRFKIFADNNHLIALDNRSSDNGAKIQMWENLDGAFVEWYLVDAETNQLFIPSATVNKASFPLRGTAVTQSKNFYIQSANDYGRSNKGYWDVSNSGKPITKSMKIEVWEVKSTVDRLYRFEKDAESPYYRIYVANTSNGVIDLVGAKTENGTKTHIWENHKGNSQKFYLQHLGNGRFKIRHMSGKILTLGGRSSENGSSVHLWDDHDGIWTEWFLIDPDTQKTYIP